MPTIKDILCGALMFKKRNCTNTNEVISRISALERQVISLKYPKGFEIGSKVIGYKFGNPDGVECFVASEIYMNGEPWIKVFVPSQSPPFRNIPVTSLFPTRNE